jgi:hypothetical protein
MRLKTLLVVVSAVALIIPVSISIQASAAPKSVTFCVNKISKAVKQKATCLKSETKVQISGQGVAGKSAYDLWIASGNTGTPGDFLKSIKGQDGSSGSSSPAGFLGKLGEQLSCQERWRFVRTKAPLVAGELIDTPLGQVVVGCGYQGPFSAAQVNGADFNPTITYAIAAAKTFGLSQINDLDSCEDYTEEEVVPTLQQYLVSNPSGNLRTYNDRYCVHYELITDTYSVEKYTGAIGVKISFSNLPADWELCDMQDDAYSSYSKSYTSYTYSHPNEFGISNVYAQSGEGFSHGGGTEATEYAGDFFMGSREISVDQNIRPVWYWYAPFCGPDSSTSSGSGWRVISGAKVLPAFKDFYVGPLSDIVSW